MRGFFLPQPASWPGTPVAPLRMTNFSLTTTEASSASLWKNRSRDLLRGSMGIEKLGPFRLAPWFSPRPWGRRDLRPWYAATGTTEPVGEAWLTGPQCVVETGAMVGQTLAAVTAEAGGALLGAGSGPEFPLLVKLLFPDDKLSVQVHPDDAHAQAMGQPRGKTECWYVLEAKPGATIDRKRVV